MLPKDIINAILEYRKAKRKNLKHESDILNNLDQEAYADILQYLEKKYPSKIADDIYLSQYEIQQITDSVEKDLNLFSVNSAKDFCSFQKAVEKECNYKGEINPKAKSLYENEKRAMLNSVAAD